MIENLSVLLNTKYNYTLTSMAKFSLDAKKTRFVKLSLIVFVLLLIAYILGKYGVIDEYVDLFFMLFSFFALVMIPLGLSSSEKEVNIIVTPKYIIQALGKTEFVVIDFDEITKYDFDKKHGLALFQKRKKIVIPFALYELGLDPIMEILEAKGKTFDPEKDFMIRPIEIIIKSGIITVKDIEVLTSTDMIFEKFLKDYNMLTPGFLNKIVFLNSVVDESFKGENCIILKIANLMVSPGHPENTTFDPIKADDCIVIFEGVEVVSVLTKDMSNSEAEMVTLPNEVKSFLGKIDKGIISDSNSKEKLFNVDFASSLDLYRVSFKFNDVIVGWNDIKQ